MNLLYAFLCVTFFSLTAPFTRLVGQETSAETVILIRIIGAGLVCVIFAAMDRWIPPRKSWPGIFATAIGSVVGFNSLMAYGLKEVPSGHAAVALAALPLATSIYAAARDGKNPGVKFWIFALLGTSLSFGFFFFMNVENILRGDLLLLLSVVSAAFGYVEGGRISREYGGSRTMTWAVLVTLPLAIVLALFHFNTGHEEFSHISFQGWLSLSYIALISQSLGMFLWFRVLSVGPMEKMALVQLLQPFLTLLAAIFILDEKVLYETWIIAFLVALCVLGSRK